MHTLPYALVLLPEQARIVSAYTAYTLCSLMCSVHIVCCTPDNVLPAVSADTQFGLLSSA